MSWRTEVKQAIEEHEIFQETRRFLKTITLISRYTSELQKQRKSNREVRICEIWNFNLNWQTCLSDRSKHPRYICRLGISRVKSYTNSDGHRSSLLPTLYGVTIHGFCTLHEVINSQ